MEDILLVIDIGNTNIVLGIFKDDELIFEWRISTDLHKTSDEYALTLRQALEYSNVKKSDVKEAIIGSVVPNLMPTIPKAVKKYLGIEPLIVDEKIKTGIVNKYASPKEVGVDRIINAVSACKKYSTPVIIVDIGTAITFDYITENKEYLGGAIAPGIAISSEALFMKTAKLPKIEIEMPDSVIGDSTVKSMQSGVVFGFIGLIDYIIEKILEEKDKTKDEVTIIATGGFSYLIAKQSKYITIIDKLITLDGLKIINDLNKND
ncbi:type III pantothenate kinase [Finegoldia magna]|uniref:Type III pantothenate kinase n=1 Tax=Finegoldia magna (strain ATCC 29328 / DSM 20472 / WAL 2508) TaxID=334413 RepID=COAX_FINM2|nr:type III pantothenate kinase [Finegoldia magna]B0S218.1 RecName: Full=Type III pantothenate kinase; AltName: Full=PanK-III; AltName: Full=Pantothenic acid kinase [Finegoldia magna ATCC 29328]UEA70238.1 type III pantothenate kinase [Finegoldia magna]BAG08408.1 transcriptional regulator Baf family [Finegoldia magna ATCC 29328]